jgi:hypothetical protein
MIAMNPRLLIGGIILLGLGTILTISLIGAIIGIPLILIGAIMAFVSIFIPNTRIDPLVTTQFPSGGSQRQIRCHKCSALNPEYAIYCNICGNKLE